jgi:membrane protein implicated in regulation of membrane protease activity
MCHVILSSPILALPLFVFFPFRTAFPAYLAVLLASGFVYVKIIGVMKSKVQTGMEGMTGRKAEVMEDINPHGKVRVGNEIWGATATGVKFSRGQIVRIAGVQGLKVIVGDSVEG